MKTFINCRDVFSMWEAIQGTVQAHAEDRHRLIEDTAVLRGRLTCSLIYTHSSQRLWRGPQWGVSICNPRAPTLRKPMWMHPLTQWEERRHKRFNHPGKKHMPALLRLTQEAQLPLIDWILFLLPVAYAFMKKAIQRQKQWALQTEGSNSKTAKLQLSKIARVTSCRTLTTPQQAGGNPCDERVLAKFLFTDDAQLKL